MFSVAIIEQFHIFIFFYVSERENSKSKVPWLALSHLSDLRFSNKRCGGARTLCICHTYHICNQDIRFGSFAHFQKCFFWCFDYYLFYILYSIFCRAKIILKFALSSFDEPKPIALVRFGKKKSKTIFQKYFCIVNINILCAMCLKLSYF